MSPTFRKTVSRTIAVSAALVLLASTAGAQIAKPLKKCPVDSVVAGTVCMDEYEASVWQVPDPTGEGKGLVAKIQEGKATLAALQAAGAVQRGVSSDDYGSDCNDDGHNCLASGSLYAVSLPGVQPAAYVNWFQASALCANSRKRLPTNAEWQAAAAGTPDTGDADDHETTCNTDGPPVDYVPTGSRAACVSNYLVFDMIGNVGEAVADWLQGSSRPWKPTKNLDAPTAADRAGEDYGQDVMRGVNPAANRPDGTVFPSMIFRGGGVASGDHGEGAGVFAFTALLSPVSIGPGGFRCVR